MCWARAREREMASCLSPPTEFASLIFRRLITPSTVLKSHSQESVQRLSEHTTSKTTAWPRFAKLPRTLLLALSESGRAIKLGNFLASSLHRPFSHCSLLGCIGTHIGHASYCLHPLPPVLPHHHSPMQTAHLPHLPYFFALHLARRFGIPRTSLSSRVE